MTIILKNPKKTKTENILLWETSPPGGVYRYCQERYLKQQSFSWDLQILVKIIITNCVTK